MRETKTKHSKYIKPSDATSWVYCKRRVWLDNHEAEIEKIEPDEFSKLVINAGLEHEANILEALKKDNNVKTAKDTGHTINLMEKKTSVIYQPQLLDEKLGVIGHPDFLILNADGEYQAADAKLSLSSDKTELKAQIGLYRKILNNKLPGLVYLGNGKIDEINEQADPIVEKFLNDMRSILKDKSEPSVRYSNSKCKQCPYYKHCLPQFEKSEDLSLIYGIRGSVANELEQLGITTISQFSEYDEKTLPSVPYLKDTGKKKKAILQANSHKTGEIIQLSKLSLPSGNWVHFDIEDNPLTTSRNKHVYLWGFLLPNYKDADFEYVWTDNEGQDFEGWIKFLETIKSYRDRFDNLVLAHYSSHEVSTIRTYANKYDMIEDETVSYLLSKNGPLFDIQKPVLDSLVLPLQGYGLKDICKHKDLVNFQWADEESGSQWSVVQFHRFLTETKEEIRASLKKEILQYNHDDVLATRKLEVWLRDNFDLE